MYEINENAAIVSFIFLFFIMLIGVLAKNWKAGLLFILILFAASLSVTISVSLHKEMSLVDIIQGAIAFFIFAGFIFFPIILFTLENGYGAFIPVSRR